MPPDPDRGTCEEGRTLWLGRELCFAPVIKSHWFRRPKSIIGPSDAGVPCFLFRQRRFWDERRSASPRPACHPHASRPILRSTMGLARNAQAVLRRGAVPEGVRCCIAGYVLLEAGKVGDRALIRDGGVHTGQSASPRNCSPRWLKGRALSFKHLSGSARRRRRPLDRPS